MLIAIISIMLPILFGYLFSRIKLFNESEIGTLRKFVVKVTVPFIIIDNLYNSDLKILNQIVPSTLAYVVISLLFTLTAFQVTKFIKDKRSANAYAISVYMGNYGFLGWGVMQQFYGDSGFTRAVFFNILFWPVFLGLGFFLTYILQKEHEDIKKEDVIKPLINHALVPFLAAFFALFLNISGITLPELLADFISKFGHITIPMILFTVGLNFKLRFSKKDLNLILLASLHRLVLGFFFGLAGFYFSRIFFYIDTLTFKVIIMEAVMPAAAMSTFFIDHIKCRGELVSGILTFSTILSLVTISLCYFILEKYGDFFFF